MNTDDGAEIWVEGERVGVAPMDAFSIPIGTREVVVRHPQLGERRVTVIVRAGRVNEVAVAFGTPTTANPYPLPSLAAPGPTLHGSK